MGLSGLHEAEEAGSLSPRQRRPKAAFPEALRWGVLGPFVVSLGGGGFRV